MNETTVPLPLDLPPRAARLALASAGLGLVLALAALGLAFEEGTLAPGVFGVACLLHIPTTLVLRGRILEGFGNRGLDRELRTVRLTSRLARAFAVAGLLAALYVLSEQGGSAGSLATLGLAALSLGVLAPLWRLKQLGADGHPSLALEANRARTLLELAALLLVGGFASRVFPWADAATAVLLALRLFWEGHTLAKVSVLKVSCGGGCGGCG